MVLIETEWSVHKVLCEQMKAIGISALSTQVLIDDAKFQKHMKLPLVRGIHEENSTRKYHTRYPSIETTAKCLKWQGEPHFGKVYGEGLASYKSVICIDHIHNAPGFTVYGKAYVGRALLVRYVLRNRQFDAYSLDFTVNCDYLKDLQVDEVMDHITFLTAAEAVAAKPQRSVRDVGGIRIITTGSQPSTAPPNCFYCNAEGAGVKRCVKCHEAFYCSKECQIAHWKVHKHMCN